MSTLVEVSPLAAEKLLAAIEGDPQKAFLRLYVAGAGCCMTRFGLAFAGSVEDDDVVVESNRVKVVVDPMSRPSVEGAVIEFVETAQGVGFMVKDPQAPAGGCTCH